MHVDAFCIENRLFLSGLRCVFAQEAARQASGLHDDGILSKCWQDWSQVEVHFAHRQNQVDLWMGVLF